MGFHTLLLFCLVMIMAWPSIWIVLDVSSKSVLTFYLIWCLIIRGKIAAVLRLKVEVFVAQLCRLFATLWTVACQTPLSMEFSRQEYWMGCHSLFPGDLPNPGINLRSPTLKSGSSPSDPPGKLIRLDLSKMCIFHHINILVFLASLD